MTGCRAVASRDASAGQCPGIGRCRGGDRLLSPVAGGDRRLPLRHVVVLAQAGGQRRRRLSPGSVSVSRTRRRQDHDERDSRQAPGDAGRLPAGYAASIRCPPSWAMAQARSASCGPAASREHRHADALPASPAGERVIGFAVHNHVDHLCKTAPGLCAHWEMLGIVLPGRARNRAFTWESAIHALWTERKAKLSTCHAAIAQKKAERLPQIYPAVIRGRNRRSMKPTNGDPGAL